MAEGAWKKALQDLDAVAGLIQRLAADVAGMREASTDEFERHKEALDRAEAESRVVKEAVRDATKAFKAAGLPAPSKEDRTVVEKKYTQIKDDLVRAKNDWREALARARAREAAKTIHARQAALVDFVASVTAPQKRVPADELEVCCWWWCLVLVFHRVLGV